MLNLLSIHHHHTNLPHFDRRFVWVYLELVLLKTPRSTRSFFYIKVQDVLMPDNDFPIARISLPSKGRLADDALNFLDACGLSVYKPTRAV